MKILKNDLMASKNAAFADSTKNNLLIQWETFIMFCLYFKMKIFPTSANTLCLFAQFLSRTFKSVGAIRNYISGTRLLNILQRHPCPSFSDIDLRLSLKGLNRLKSRAVHQAFPMTPYILSQIYNRLDFSRVVDTVMWALCTLAFFTLSRKSNLVATSSHSFDRQLRRADIKLCTFGILVHFNWSKTIQFRERRLSIPVVSIPGSVLCPVRAYFNMIKRIKVPQSSPAFVWPNNKGVTYKQFHTFLRSYLTKLGYDCTKYSSHSFRRGGATWAFQNGVPVESIQNLGDWHSDSYKRYLFMDLNQKMDTANMMVKDLRITNFR